MSYRRQEPRTPTVVQLLYSHTVREPRARSALLGSARARYRPRLLLHPAAAGSQRWLVAVKQPTRSGRTRDRRPTRLLVQFFILYIVCSFFVCSWRNGRVREGLPCDASDGPSGRIQRTPETTDGLSPEVSLCLQQTTSSPVVDSRVRHANIIVPLATASRSKLFFTFQTNCLHFYKANTCKK